MSGALGFSLWTSSQKALTAFESSGINNLMLIEIAAMDALFFGRTFTVTQMLAIVWIQAGGKNRRPGTTQNKSEDTGGTKP